ncbi:hypothetical protein GE09DRAFT_1280413 [Coniochaeta sp. 2T2.1]|nr:hypothetical protein GE09DRAFT_1280413 [Coniochaeta sp. 2T2.1]
MPRDAAIPQERRQQAARDAATTVEEVLRPRSIAWLYDIREPLDRWPAAEARYTRSLKQLKKFIRAVESAEFEETASHLTDVYEILVGGERDASVRADLREAIRGFRERAWGKVAHSSVLECHVCLVLERIIEQREADDVFDRVGAVLSLLAYRTSGIGKVPDVEKAD